MAGNTKFIGFLADNRIQLERWGGKVIISLDPTSIEALRSAVSNDLPRKPVQGRSDHLDEFNVQYASDVGRVAVDLSVEGAAYLADLIETLVKDSVQAMEKMKPLVDGLRSAVQAHSDFHDTNEPGVVQ